MLFKDFLKWWYGPGWATRLSMLSNHLKNMSEFFSLGTLLLTLFAPWRQNVVTARSDQALGDKFNAGLDNMISRLVGFFVRIFMMITGVIALFVTLVLNTIYIIIWPIIPLSPAIILSVGVTL